MPDEFKVVMAGLFELSRDRASTKNAGGDVSSLDHSSIDPLKEKETDAEEGSQGAIQETGVSRCLLMRIRRVCAHDAPLS